MKRTALVAGIAATCIIAPAASAQTLEEALSMAYRTNPTITAERARQKGTKEQKAQAWANALPQISVNAGYVRNDVNQTVDSTVFNPAAAPAPSQEFKFNTADAGVQASQPIFTGLRNYNAIKAARSSVKAGASQLSLVEQSVLVDAARAYFDVVRDMAVYESTANNVEVLVSQQREATVRFNVGEVTKTDVAQADARLAQARAQLTTAQARLAVSRVAFARIIGDTPGALEKDPSLPQPPATLEEALSVADAASPVVLRAKFTEEASRRNVAVAKGAFSPTVSLTASYQYADQPSTFISRNEQFAYGVRITAPIFLGGLNLSRVREARAANEADRRRIDEAERGATAQVTSAWEQLSAARANISSASAQLDANDLALNGVRREAQLGTRTTLDVLNAEQEYLNAEVALANAQHDARLATFQLLAAMGVLGPDGAAE